jgi:butyryl-CoA dehydrogenase
MAAARRALDHAVAYARDRRQFGRPICEFGLVKQKLADMTVRCFVGEAMVYRALGDVDRALDGVDAADGAHVLGIIESFAVECSINKVWSSEALGHVTDEAVQVFGGNGYSREFPVERAFRDARITRIYEGTNEINRLIIATRILKSPATLVARDVPRPPQVSAFATEHELLAHAKVAATAALSSAAAAYGSSVKDEQEVLAHVANIIIEIYAIESAVGRAEKMSTGARGDIGADAARVHASDAADRILHAGRQIARTLRGRVPVDGLTLALGAVRDCDGVDTVAARRRIGDAAIASGRYPF